MEFLKEAIDRDQNNPEPYHKLAEIFLTLKEIDKAIHYAIECNKYKQNDPDLSNLIGLCYLLKVRIYPIPLMSVSNDMKRIISTKLRNIS